MLDSYLWYNVLSDHHLGSKMKIIYIHGFNSGGSTNEKAKMLAERFGDVYAPDLPHTPDDAMQVLVDKIMSYDNAELDDLVLVGTSLGGFYAHHLSKVFGIKAVLINPSLDPMTTLGKMIGRQKNYATGVEYVLTAADVAQLEKYYVDPAAVRVPTIVAVDLDDELLDANVAIAKFNKHAKILAFKGGNHRFTHMANILDDIANIEHVMYD